MDIKERELKLAQLKALIEELQNDSDYVFEVYYKTHNTIIGYKISDVFYSDLNDNKLMVEGAGHVECTLDLNSFSLEQPKWGDEDNEWYTFTIEDNPDETIIFTFYRLFY